MKWLLLVGLFSWSVAVAEEAIDTTEKMLQRGEPPYPGASTEEFADTPMAPAPAPLPPAPAGSAQAVTVETANDGERQVVHPYARKGLKRILKDGTYIYDTEPTKPSASDFFSSRGVKEVNEDGTYIYHTEKEQVEDPNHPFRSKGLISQQDGTYRYKVEESPREATYTIRFGATTEPEFSREVNGTTIDFNTIYQSATLTQVGFTRDWRLSQRSLRLTFGMDLAFATGNGIFVDDPESEAPEVYSFFMIPVTLGVLYRAQFSEGQTILPFFGGGAGITGVIEQRDDGKRTAYNMTPAAYGVGGIGINMDVFDRDRMNMLDASRGINDIYLTIEARTSQSLDKKLDFSSSSLALGFIIDY